MMAAGASPFPPGFKVLFYGNSYMRQVTVRYFVLFLCWSAPCEQHRVLRQKQVGTRASPRHLKFPGKYYARRAQ